MNKPIVQLCDYEDAQEFSLGWCPTCQEFTTEGIEIDADECRCEECKGFVTGVGIALLLGMFSINEDPKDC